MPLHFHAVAVDYDGTLASDDRPDRGALAALAAVRKRGVRAVLVTGRIGSELLAVFPEAGEHFDALVTENGAVLGAGTDARALSAPVPVELDADLLERGIPFRRGRVLLACRVQHEHGVLDALRSLGADGQLVRNRSELMVLPPGVSKASGLDVALAELGLTAHDAIAVGDAENDLVMLEHCEVGVAVANAAPFVRAHADVELGRAAGDGVTELLEGPILEGGIRVEPLRWRALLGRDRRGAPVRLPASRVDLLIAGASGAGKSFLAGLFVEGILGLGYSVCIFDPEGDHTSLAELRNVTVLGHEHGPLPPPAALAHLVARRPGGLVVDLSGEPRGRRARYLREAIEVLERQRAERGIPHWIVLDEAQASAEGSTALLGGTRARSPGHCLVTHRPSLIPPAVIEAVDIIVHARPPDGVAVDRDDVAVLARRASLEPEMLDRELRALAPGEDLLLELDRGREPRAFRPADRRSAHVRHLRKYLDEALPPERHFAFRTIEGPTGRSAWNVRSFLRELRSAPIEVLVHHAHHGDLSRWFLEALQDHALATQLRAAEARLRDATTRAERERAREAVVAGIESRYGSA